MCPSLEVSGMNEEECILPVTAYFLKSFFGPSSLAHVCVCVCVFHYALYE